MVGDVGDGHDSRAFLWTRARGMQDLNALIPVPSPFWLQEAVSINDLGQIVALGRGDDRSHQHENQHGRAVPVLVFLLVPVR